VPWHAAKLRLTRVFFPLGFVALVRAGLLTRPSSATDGLPLPNRRRVTWRPSFPWASWSQFTSLTRVARYALLLMGDDLQ